MNAPPGYANIAPGPPVAIAPFVAIAPRPPTEHERTVARQRQRAEAEMRRSVAHELGALFGAWVEAPGPWGHAAFKALWDEEEMSSMLRAPRSGRHAPPREARLAAIYDDCLERLAVRGAER